MGQIHFFEGIGESVHEGEVRAETVMVADVEVAVEAVHFKNAVDLAADASLQVGFGAHEADMVGVRGHELFRELVQWLDPDRQSGISEWECQPHGGAIRLPHPKREWRRGRWAILY